MGYSRSCEVITKKTVTPSPQDIAWWVYFVCFQDSRKTYTRRQSTIYSQRNQWQSSFPIASVFCTWHLTKLPFCNTVSEVTELNISIS